MDEKAPEDLLSMTDSGSCAEVGLVELQLLQETVAQLSRENNELRNMSEAKKDVLIRYAHQRIESLEAERDTAIRRADSWQNSHASLLSSVQEYKDQISNLTREKHQALANLLREQGRVIEKDREIRSKTRELDVIAHVYRNITSLNKEECSSRMNGINSKQRYEFRPAEAAAQGKEKDRRLVQCTQCYTKKWPCDAGQTCKACIARGIPDGCIHMKCQFWEIGSCVKSECGLAHPEDGFPKLTGFRKLKRKAFPMPPGITPTLETPALPPSKLSNLQLSKKLTHHEGSASDNTTITKRPRLVKMPTKPEDEYPQEMETGPDAEDAPGRTMFFATFTVLRDYAHYSLEEARAGDYSCGNYYEEHYPKNRSANTVHHAPGFVGGSLQDSASQAKLDVEKLFGLSPGEAANDD